MYIPTYMFQTFEFKWMKLSCISSFGNNSYIANHFNCVTPCLCPVCHDVILLCEGSSIHISSFTQVLVLIFCTWINISLATTEWLHDRATTWRSPIRQQERPLLCWIWGIIIESRHVITNNDELCMHVCLKWYHILRQHDDEKPYFHHFITRQFFLEYSNKYLPQISIR